ncbi:MAG: lysophospholipid acyltransferase family protein [Burkholderiales bacterium]
MPATPATSSKPSIRLPSPPAPTGPFTRLARLFRGGLHVFEGLAIMLFLFPFTTPAGRRRHIRRWSAQLLALFGVRVKVKGEAPGRSDAPLMLAANHVSWLDIFVILARVDVRFVSKSEVRQWPLVGYLAATAGTLFLRRARKTHVAQINREIGEALTAGDLVAIFPEGTATDGGELLPFHASLLAPATAAGVPVQPVALRFADVHGTLNTDAAYDGDKSLIDTLRLMTRHRTIVAELNFLPVVKSSGRTRRELATSLEKSVARALNVPAPKRHAR